MKVQIKAEVPTSYQLSSIRAFALAEFNSNMSGSFTAHQEFDTIKEAKNFLKKRAEALYFDEKEMKKNLGKNYLQYDAATAWIEKIEK